MDFSIQDCDLRNCFETEKTLLLVSGFYPLKNKNSSWISKSSAFVNLFVICGQILSMIIQMGIDRKNLSKLIGTSLIFITDLTFVLKLVNFIYYKEKMFAIEDTLVKPIFYNHPLETLEFVKKRVRHCKFVAKPFRLTCILVVLLNVTPLLNSEKILPLPGWMPLDTKKYFYPIALFQVMSVAVSAYNNSSIDILTCMLISLATAEFDILKENLKNIDYKINNVNSKERVRVKLDNCVRHHKEIVKFAHLVEDFFSRGIFLQFFASVAVICFTGFQMILAPILSLQFIFLSVYFSSMMCQIAMYCWYGHEVFTTSDSIGTCFYMSNWYESDLSIRKNMLIFMERIKKPVILTAGSVVTLSLTTFTTILRSSYSYFAVLQQLYADEA